MNREFTKPAIIRLVLAFLISSFIFSMFFLFSYGVSYMNYQYVVEQNNFMEEKLIEVENLLEDFECGGNYFLESSNRLREVNIRMGILEQRFGKLDERVLEQKKIYTNVQKNHFEIVKKIGLKCDYNLSIILFFYSNIGELEEFSERTGHILDFFASNNPGLIVYSFDYNLDSEYIGELKVNYNITRAPLVVVNEQEPFNLRNINELGSYFQ